MSKSAGDADSEVETGVVKDPQPAEDASKMSTKPAEDASKMSTMMKAIIALLAACTTGLLISTIVLAVKDSDDSKEEPQSQSTTTTLEDNPCARQRPPWDNVACVEDQIEMNYATGEQSGVNVTKGFQGSRNTTAVPITMPYREAGLCPVNVHWHLGTEHYSVGEFDEFGTGPIEFHEGRIGFQCRYYDENDEKFTNPYEWQHCIGMTIGQTYEVHWPHSAFGMCNTPWQYQTPFYDGVFCQGVDVFTDTAAEIGVQSQVFTVVNDEEYYYADLFRGMIVDGDRGTDLAKYTGSTTGTARDNEICSPFTPITWQVDRKCHLISASSFDKMCSEMKVQADNLSDDLYAHGSRELVKPEHSANNQQRRRRGFRG